MPVITDISFEEDLNDKKIGKEYSNYILENSTNFITLLADDNCSQAKKKMYLRKLKSSFLNTHEFSQLLKTKNYDQFNEMCNVFSKYDI